MINDYRSRFYQVTMKTLGIFAGLTLLILSSCATNKNTASYEADDRYFSLADARREQKQLKKLNAAATQPDDALTEDDAVVNDNTSRTGDYDSAPSADDGQTTIINNYYDDDYDMDNYYDYMYASRIRRFNRFNPGFAYYDPFYTNAYWYNYDPFLFGNSIYSSYSFFNPYVPWGWNTWSNPGFSVGWNSWTGWNVGFGWNSWGYNPYMYNNPWRWNTWGYNPYYSPFAYNPFFYSPYNYGMGYMNGFNDGFAYGMMMNSMYNNPVYYNSYDQNTYNYGNSVYYGANTGGGVGSGSGFSGMSSLSSNLGDKIGTNYQVADGGKVGSVSSPKPSVQTAKPVKNEATVKPASDGTGKPTLSSSVQTPDKTSDKNNLQPVKQGAPAVSQPIQANQTAPSNNSKPTATSGKDNLIQQGVYKPKADNYSSAPVADPSRPASTVGAGKNSTYNLAGNQQVREPNISAPSRGASTNATVNTPQKMEEVRPAYNFNGAIRGENTQPAKPSRSDNFTPAASRPEPSIRSNDVRSSEPVNRSGNNLPERQQQNVQPPRNNYNSRDAYQAPQREQRQPQQPSYQDYQSPKREQRENRMETPTRREERPRYEAPRNSSSPRNSYQAPSSGNGNSGGSYRNESKPQSQPSSPRSSGGGFNSSPKSSPSSGGNSSSGGSSSPKLNGSRR